MRLFARILSIMFGPAFEWIEEFIGIFTEVSIRVEIFRSTHSFCVANDSAMHKKKQIRSLLSIIFEITNTYEIIRLIAVIDPSY